MVIRHYFLWDGNKTAVYAIIGAFILTYGTTLAFTIVSVTSMHRTSDTFLIES